MEKQRPRPHSVLFLFEIEFCIIGPRCIGSAIEAQERGPSLYKKQVKGYKKLFKVSITVPLCQFGIPIGHGEFVTLKLYTENVSKRNIEVHLFVDQTSTSYI